MSAQQYIRIINMVLISLIVLLILPIIIYVARTRKSRLNDIISYFDDDAIKSYYEQFRPSQPLGARSRDEFEKQVRRRYSTWFYVPPLLLFVMLIVSLGWAAVNTLTVWFKLTPFTPFVLTGLGMSALAGAAMWVISDELDRVRRRDFTTTDVYGYVFRILLSVPFGWALAHIVLEAAWLPAAFFLGGFPTTTLFRIARRLGAKQLNLADDPQTGELELEKLQCVNKSNAERFQDEGIMTICQLAYCDPIDLTLRTNFDFNYVVDCVSQALLWIYLPDKVNTIFAYSLRGAQEVVSLVDDIKNNNAQAIAVRDAAADALKIPPQALQATLEQVAGDPYTLFLKAVWH
jgi:hypothetical protein